MRTPAQIVEQYFLDHSDAQHENTEERKVQIKRYMTDVVREAQREAMNGIHMVARESLEPQFAPEGEPDKYRDLWEANMPRVSACMYFAIPGEQPIHVSDDEAHHILAYLSEANRG